MKYGLYRTNLDGTNGGFLALGEEQRKPWYGTRDEAVATALAKAADCRRYLYDARPLPLTYSFLYE